MNNRSDSVKRWFRVYGLLAVNVGIWCLDPSMEIKIMGFAGQNLLQFLTIALPILVCTGLMDVWVEREVMVRMMGKNAGWKGHAIALLAGILTAVPIYALLPIAGLLLKKGCRIANALLFVCASAGLRIPLLLFEISSFGLVFTLLRFILNGIGIWIVSFLTEWIVIRTSKIKFNI